MTKQKQQVNKKAKRMFYKLITNSSTSGFFVWLASIQRDATEDVPASAAPRCTSLHSTPPHLTSLLQNSLLFV